ncbi:MAG: peptidoglycan-binding protein [Patescibacteria group bacterium]|nr:peptidoglycan-binding protein [Patescibacteria group bacterium]
MRSKLSQKIVAVGLSLSTAVWLGGALMIAPASAATTTDLQAQIQALLAQVQQLQAQLAAQGGTTSTASCTFTRDLTVGSTGADVKCLQEYLNASGYTVASTGSGSAGHETTYFGTLTAKAVAKWQAAHGVTPSAGYFGPKSRAEYVALTTTTSTTTPTSTTTGPTAQVPSTGLAASLASNSVAAGSVIAGAGQIPVGSFTFTASSASGETITGLTFTKVGVVSDSNVTNMYLADSTGNVVAQYQSLSSGVASFSGLNLNVPAGQSATYTLKMDLSSSAAAGNTIAWQLTGATLASGDTVSGTPVTASTQTVTTVSNPSLSSATFTFNAVGSSVNAGTTGVLAADLTANVTNNAVWLKGMKFTEVGSANTSDLQNLKLYVAGTQVGQTVASVASDGTVYFNLSSSNVKLNTGTTDIQLYADIMGSPNRTAEFTILHNYDVSATDSQYNSGITTSVTTTNATTITINAGTLTVSQDANTPTGNVAQGVSAVTLAKFDVKAAGEAVRINFISASITGTGWTSVTNAEDDLKNIRLIDNAGGQVGNTISTIGNTSSSGDCSYSSGVITCYFGTSSSNINYTIPANTTRVLSLVADLQSSMTATALQGALVAGSSNAVGQISNQTTSSGAATGATLTVVSSSLTSATNSAVGTMTYAAGAQNQKVGSFTLTASSAQGANVSSLTFTTGANTNLKLQNMYAMVGSTQFGSTAGTVNTGTATAYTFSGSTPINVPAGGAVTVDVYASILSGSTAATYSGVVSLTNWTATGQASGSSIAFDSSRTGQSVTVSSGATLTLALDNSSPAAGQVSMGSTGNTLGVFDLTDNNVEPVNVTAITLTDTVSNNTGTRASFQNLTLWTGGSQVAGPLNLTMASATSGTVTFNPTTPISVPQNGTTVLTLKGDVASYSSGGAASTSSHVFNVAATSSVTAIGAQSNVSATVSGTPSAAAQVVMRSVMGTAVAALGSTTGRVKTSSDQIGTVTLSASSQGSVYLQTVKVTFGGNAVTGASSTLLGTGTVVLLDPNGNSVVASDNATLATSTCVGQTSCYAQWTFGSSAGSGYLITAGSSAKFTVQVDSTQTQTASSGNAVGLTATIAGNSSVTYSDGTSNGTSVSISPTPPTTINAVTYASGT